jgi:type II secretory pathway pseudopilin PulG
MKNIRLSAGFTVVEMIVLTCIAAFVLGIAIPKFTSATNLRRAKEVSVLLNRLYEAEYSYHHKHKVFTSNLEDLPVSGSSLRSKWFVYSAPYATKDTFFVMARVARPFGKATTADWAGISSAKNRSISNTKTLGKYAVEWTNLIKKDDEKWYNKRINGDIEYEPN